MSLSLATTSLNVCLSVADNNCELSANVRPLFAMSNDGSGLLDPNHLWLFVLLDVNSLCLFLLFDVNTPWLFVMSRQQLGVECKCSAVVCDVRWRSDRYCHSVGVSVWHRGFTSHGCTAGSWRPRRLRRRNCQTVKWVTLCRLFCSTATYLVLSANFNAISIITREMGRPAGQVG